MATKTYPELLVQSDVEDSDLLASWRGVGPLKQLVASLVKDYIIEAIETGGISIDGQVVVTNAFGNNRSGLKVEQYATDLNTGNYGFELHAYQGANIGMVLHDYTNLITGLPAFQIDKTNVGPVVELVLAENAITSPGTRGEGPFIAFVGYGLTTPDTRTSLGYISKYLQFASTDPQCQWTFSNGVVCVAGDTETNRALTVTALNTGYAGTIAGVASGLRIDTSDDDGVTLTVVKSGSNGGVGLLVANEGSGNSITAGPIAGQNFFVNPDGHVGVGTEPGVYGVAVLQASATQAYFGSTGAHDALVIIDSNTAGNEAVVGFTDGGSPKWNLGKKANNTFALTDRVNAIDLLTTTTTGGITLGASSQEVGFYGTAPVAKPATPVTLGDVIAALQALGLVA